MKLGIVIPLKSQKISKNWQVTCDSLENTLCSITAQDDGRYQVAVAGHDIPERFYSQFPNVQFITVDIPVPDRSAPDFSHKKLIEDKNLKLAFAMNALQNDSITHWFGLDSDDLLAKSFVSTVLNNINGKAGATIEGGYLLYHDVERAIATNEMTQYCGSTSVISAEHIAVPETPTLESLSGIPWSRYPHMNIHHYFSQELKADFVPFEEPLLGYVLASGDNISDKWRDGWLQTLKAKMKPLLKGKKYSPELKNTFSIDLKKRN